MTRNTIKLNLLVFSLTAFFIIPGVLPAVHYSKSAVFNSPSFYDPIQSGKDDLLQGVFVPNVLELPIVQQPADDPYYVSNHNGEVTQFSIASQYGNVGLLAHNNLSGKSFSKLSLGQEVELVYGDGSVEDFIITKVLHYQALQPQSQQSLFLDLDNSETLSANQMFNRVYTGSRHLTFQTCITANGDASWGRLFIVAMPKVQ